MGKMKVCKQCHKKYAPCIGCDKDFKLGIYNFRIDYCSPDCYRESLKPIITKTTKPKVVAMKKDKE